MDILFYSTKTPSVQTPLYNLRIFTNPPLSSKTSCFFNPPPAKLYCSIGFQVCSLLICICDPSFAFGPPGQLITMSAPPPGGYPGGIPGGVLKSHVYHVCFWDPVKMLFWLHLWSHWASIISKLTLKRHHFQVPELHGVLTGNCTPARREHHFHSF